MHLQTSLHINAPIERVWELTLDVESWPRLTPTVTKVEHLDTGPLAVGSRTRVKQPAQRAKVWTVTELEAGRRFAWTTSAFGGSMTGAHDLTPDGSGTANTLTIDLDGPFAGLVGMLFGRTIRRAIETENKGFKTAAEARPGC